MVRGVCFPYKVMLSVPIVYNDTSATQGIPWRWGWVAVTVADSVAPILKYPPNTNTNTNIDFLSCPNTNPNTNTNTDKLIR